MIANISKGIAFFFSTKKIIINDHIIINPNIIN